MLAALRAASVVGLASLLSACTSRAISPAAAPAVDARADRAENQRARGIVCGEELEQSCLESCPHEQDPREHVACLLGLRFGADPEALDLARRLYERSHLLVGPGPTSSIEGFHGTEIAILPALPVGDKRHHLAWIDASIAAYSRFVAELATHTDREISFRTRPGGFLFFRTPTPTYPSAYFTEGLIAYNVDGPLHDDRRDMHETLFHELFHVNDALHDGWSSRVLEPIYEAIVARCGSHHDCYVPYAAHDTIVQDGTYYAFDERTRDVREYAAELALRYYLEHEAVLGGAPLAGSPFKCRTAENGAAWSALVDELFGGVDLTAACDPT